MSDASVPHAQPIRAGNVTIYASATFSRHSVYLEITTRNEGVIAVMSPDEARRVARTIEAAADAAEPRA